MDGLLFTLNDEEIEELKNTNTTISSIDGDEDDDHLFGSPNAGMTPPLRQRIGSSGNENVDW